MIDKREIFLIGDKVFLKSLNEYDIKNSEWFGWFNNSDTTEFLQHGYFTNTLKKQEDFYKQNIENSNNKLQLAIIPKESDQIIGVVSLSDIDFINRKAEFGITIGSSDFRGQGIGLEVTNLITSHGFKKLSLNKIWLGVHANHNQAIKCYIKAGFKQEAVLKEEILFASKYYDLIRMSILAKDYFK